MHGIMILMIHQGSKMTQHLDLPGKKTLVKNLFYYYYYNFVEWCRWQSSILHTKYLYVCMYVDVNPILTIYFVNS